MKLQSPAKINLYLKVLGKRPDGYHELDTLFERISLTDEIYFLPAPSGIRIQTDSNVIPTGPKNLAYQAAKLLKEELGIQKGVRIKIKKRIPVAAGLGGGSSNAATVLLGLNRFWKLSLSKEKLLSLAAKLGSDVPFFILETSFAFGQGRGEVLKEVKAGREKIWHCVVKPPFSISTKEAYAALKAPLRPKSRRLTLKNPNVKMLLHSICRGQKDFLSKLLINSLEVALSKRVITILKIKKELVNLGALGALMSGSGSSVFGIYGSREQALEASRVLKRTHKNWKVFTVSTF